MIKTKGLRRRLPTYGHTEAVYRDERDPKGNLVARTQVGWRDVSRAGRTLGAKVCKPTLEIPKAEWGNEE